MNETVKMICNWEMAARKVQSYKPRTNKIKSKFNNKTKYVCNEHCDIVIERFKSDVICHNDNRSLVSVDWTALWIKLSNGKA